MAGSRPERSVCEVVGLGEGEGMFGDMIKFVISSVVKLRME